MFDRPAVGFDLDMTLVNSFPGIAATMQALMTEIGVMATREQVWPHIGLPLEDTLGILAPDHDSTALARRYRELYPGLGVPVTSLLPGALEALRAVRNSGARTLVISAKSARGVIAVIRQVGLADGPDAPDLVAGDLYAEAKGMVLKRERAVAYVGDHPGDVIAARIAGAHAVGVLSGPASADQLRDAGADVVLEDLREFPDWWLRASRAEPG